MEGDNEDKNQWRFTLDGIRYDYSSKEITEKELVDQLFTTVESIKNNSEKEFELLYLETNAIIRKYEERLFFYNQINTILVVVLGSSGFGLIFTIINTENEVISKSFSGIGKICGVAVLIILLLQFLINISGLPILFKDRERVYYKVLFDMISDMRK